MMKLVVGAQSWQGPRPNTVGKEDLRGTVDPRLRVRKLGPIWRDVCEDADVRAGQGDGTEEKDGHDEVWK